ncbi:hypothetical protein [Pedobacter cryophilus]|uniref:Uncharacterized protein n=1 Tax=Pedobacter cryophilus TaxID=2571271 RepID=A0A4U1BVB0_9SPHI|nr:hypothetical protein [Pedobacter cryophilus]TKB96051.1 hypothetical protein FA046_15405 [Pedobacter cryophilus]
MKVLITSAKQACSFELAYLLKDEEILFGENHYPSPKFPSVNSPSLAHELLSFCLDFEIEQVYAVRAGELKSLLEAKILFAEFGIEIIGSNFIYDDADAQSESYANFSSKLLASGYPNQKLAIGQTNFNGDLIVINDEQKDFNWVWSKLNELSFTQLGKLFNQPNFEILSIYTLQENLQLINVLILNSQLRFTASLPSKIMETVKTKLHHEANGFYQVYLSGDKILRIKNVAH